MQIHLPTPLLGGLSPREFMARHWQKRPLLIRQAVPAIQPLLTRAELFALAANGAVESRLVAREGRRWLLRHGPFKRRALPSVAQTRWTLLVQGLEQHVAAAHDLLERFRFVPDARLDDLMLSYATDGGGVGPHLDSYDVFLLQVQGTREWRIGRVAQPKLSKTAPLKVLSNFRAEQRWLLQPGDMLYLPPRWAHEGTARGECMTASIGFRAPSADGIADQLLQRWRDDEPDVPQALEALCYQDLQQGATRTPGRIPPALRQFAADALRRELAHPRRLERALGELLSEPKPSVVFEPGAALQRQRGVRLDPRSRLLYDEHHVFINGESFLASGPDARALRRLADRHCLAPDDLVKLSTQARSLVDEWARCGWLEVEKS
ncbi:MAG: cupin domain-containing protein [Burkholderiaceae bacterium]